MSSVALQIGAAGGSAKHGGRRGDFAKILRGYSNARLIARSKALSFDTDNPNVRRVAQEAAEHIGAWLEGLTEEQRGYLWAPRVRTIAHLLGALYSGVKLSFKGKNAPIPEWNLSIAEWAERLKMAPATVSMLFKYLGTEPILAPRSRDDTGPSEVIGSGLALIERIPTTAPMRVWFKRNERFKPQAHGKPPKTPPANLDDPESYDAIVELNGPAKSRLTRTGLKALGLEEDLVDYQSQRLALSGAIETIAPSPTGSREHRAPQPAPSRRQRTFESQKPIFEIFSERIGRELAATPLPTDTQPPSPVVTFLASRHSGALEMQAASGAENFAERWIEKAQGKLGRELSGREASDFRESVYAAAFAHLLARLRAPDG